MSNPVLLFIFMMINHRFIFVQIEFRGKRTIKILSFPWLFYKKIQILSDRKTFDIKIVMDDPSSIENESFQWISIINNDDIEKTFIQYIIRII